MANQFIASGGLQLTRKEAEEIVRAQFAERLRAACADERCQLEAEIQQQIEIRLRQPKPSPYNLY